MNSIGQEIYPGSSRIIKYDWEARAKQRVSLAMDLKTAGENLAMLKDALDDVGVRHWLCFGTLLGAIRDQGFIAHDKDTDICLFLNSPAERPRIIKALKVLEGKGLRLIRDEGCLITLMRNDEYIDLYDMKLKFRKWRRIWECMGWEFPYKHFASCEKINFLGRAFCIPSNAEDYLSKVYGLDWKLPRKDFHPEDPIPEPGFIGRLRQTFRLRTRLRQLLRRS